MPLTRTILDDIVEPDPTDLVSMYVHRLYRRTRGDCLRCDLSAVFATGEHHRHQPTCPHYQSPRDCGCADCRRGDLS